jgi:hypothetical protein
MTMQRHKQICWQCTESCILGILSLGLSAMTVVAALSKMIDHMHVLIG